MVDVKVAVRWALTVWYISLAGLLALGIWARKGGWWDAYRAGLSRGGWLTTALVGALVLFSLLSFGVFFVAFHNVFFEAGTWMFNYSDTLIRLFPQRFWSDIFIYVGILAVGGGLAVSYIFRPKQPS
jgi:integral membrane protein (TIGR01906 family)